MFISLHLIAGINFCTPKKGVRERNPQRLKTETPSIRLDDYCKNIADKNWERVSIRKTPKGLQYVYVHIATVWHWDAIEKNARERILIITKTDEKNPRMKFSFSNGKTDRHTEQEYAYFQCSRYWIERSFDDAKTSWDCPAIKSKNGSVASSSSTDNDGLSVYAYTHGSPKAGIQADERQRYKNYDNCFYALRR